MKKLTQENKGITLIALVITIIVLLILAAVTIATLTGENGILTKATTAKENTERAEVVERAKVDILSYLAENKGGEITIKQLKDVLSTYFTEVPEEKELQEKLKEKHYKLKLKPEYGGQDIEISDIYDGVLTEGMSEKAKEVNAVIGQTVDYEIRDELNNEIKEAIGGWRVFYASNDEMFLISSKAIRSTTVFGADSTGIPIIKKEAGGEGYTGATDVFATDYGETYNSMWKATKSTNTADKSKAIAYLCDPTNWKDYVGTNAPEGTYAVGGPTKELFILSWNASRSQTNVKEVALAKEDVTEDGYAEDKPGHLHDDRPITTTILQDENGIGLYNPGASYWMASPSNITTRYVFIVHKDGYLPHANYYLTGIGVRPLVSIPMSKVQIKDEIVTIGNN